MRRVERRSVTRRGGTVPCQLFNEGDKTCRGKDGICTLGRFRGMTGRSTDMGDKLHAALMGADRRHFSGLADDGDPWSRPAGSQKGRHALGAETADFLIKGEGKIKRFAQESARAWNSGACASAIARKPFMSTAPRP